MQVVESRMSEDRQGNRSKDEGGWNAQPRGQRSEHRGREGQAYRGRKKGYLVTQVAGMKSKL